MTNTPVYPPLKRSAIMRQSRRDVERLAGKDNSVKQTTFRQITNYQTNETSQYVLTS